MLMSRKPYKKLLRSGDGEERKVTLSHILENVILVQATYKNGRLNFNGKFT